MIRRVHLDTTIGQLTKIRIPRRFKKIEQVNYENLSKQIYLCIQYSLARTKP